MDALYHTHTTPAYFEFNRRIPEHGLQHALIWRDDPSRKADSSLRTRGSQRINP